MNYVREGGSDEMRKITSREPGRRLAVAAISRVDLNSALIRRTRTGDVSIEQTTLVECTLTADLASRYLVQPVTDRVLELAIALIKRHALRAYDAIQLGACITLRALPTASDRAMTFVCADRELIPAAAAEAIGVLDPTSPAPG